MPPSIRPIEFRCACGFSFESFTDAWVHLENYCGSFEDLLKQHQMIGVALDLEPTSIMTGTSGDDSGTPFPSNKEKSSA